MKSNNLLLTQKYSSHELVTFKTILQVVSQGNIENSRNLFNKLNAQEINRFHHFRNAFRNLSKAEKLTFFAEETEAQAS